MKGVMYMQTRPSTVYVRKCCVKRKTLRCVLLFVFVAMILLCCDVNFLTAMLLSGASVIVVRILVLP